jgi:hypothetical protein
MHIFIILVASKPFSSCLLKKWLSILPRVCSFVKLYIKLVRPIIQYATFSLLVLLHQEPTVTVCFRKLKLQSSELAHQAGQKIHASTHFDVI